MNGERALPTLATVALARARYETRLFFRRKDALFFTLLLPVMFLVLFGMIFGNDKVGDTGIVYSQVLVSGILAAGVMSVTFVNLAIAIANERGEGSLQRLAGTPTPRLAYFLGKFGMVMVTVVLEVILVLGIGAVLYDVQLPSSIGRWLTFGLVLLLGTAASTVLGIAASSVPRSAKSAAAVINLPFVALQFISGVYVPYDSLPKAVRTIASIFPLKWIAQGFRSVFLPDAFLRVEPGGSWQHGSMVVVLAVWTALGTALAARTFSWTSKK